MALETGFLEHVSLVFKKVKWVGAYLWEGAYLRKYDNPTNKLKPLFNISFLGKTILFYF